MKEQTDKLVARLTELSRQLQGGDGCDKELIVTVGSFLEGAAEELPQGGSALPDGLRTALEALQAVYQQSVADAPAAMKAVAGLLSCMARQIAEPSAAEGEQATRQAVEGLRAALAATPQAQDAQGAHDAPKAAGEVLPARPPAQAVSPANTTDSGQAPAAAPSLQDLVARLMGLSAAEVKELEQIKAGLERCASAESLIPAARPLMLEAAGLLGQIVSSQAADAEAALAGATSALERALLAAEGQAVSASMPAAEPIAQTPNVQQGTQPQAAVTSVAPSAAPTAGIANAADAGRLPADADMELLKEYIVESLDHITAAEAALLSLETNPDDVEAVNTVFRGFHTLKGTSGFLGLSAVQKLAHLAENLLEKARSQEIRLVGGYADIALKSCDTLKSMIAALQGVRPGDVLFVPEHFEQLRLQLQDPAAAGISEESAGGPMRVGDILVGMDKVERKTVEQVAQEVKDRPLGEALVQQGEVAAGDVAKALRTQKQMAGAQNEASVRVNTARLDSLINMVGELVIAQSMVAQDPDVIAGKPRLVRSVSHAGKIVRELQDLGMGLRMVPLKATFQKMTRLVRDVARKSEKSVQFITEGDDTEIDRNMVEVLNDPLVHMIRNAVDHGVEAASARSAAGKNPVGTVWLRAYHAAGNVIIELQDDGKGLDRQKILAKAVERGLVDSGKDLTESEIFNLIFLPGFSTAEKITDVSGRGVGMDVVRKSIESLRGRVDIASKPGQGSKFMLRLPLTMAIVDAMILRVGQQRYLLPMVSIEQSFRPGAAAVSTIAGKGEMVNLRGRLLPLFRLHRMFNISGAITDAANSIAIVIEAQGRSCALMVDELLGQQQVVIKALGQAFKDVRGVAGGAILGDGRVGLVLDTAGLISVACGDKTASAA